MSPDPARGAPLPDHLPILDRRGGDLPGPSYREREITGPVDLCDARGRLRPEAVGFARRPLFRANLSGHPLRKKQWNFWNFIDPDFVLSVTLADIDYAAFCSVAFLDLAAGRELRTTKLAWPGLGLPEHVERPVSFLRPGLEYVHRDAQGRGDLDVRVRARTAGGEIAADLVVRRPPGHESLNVVVPWSPSRFQCNSKHAALPCQGELRVGERRLTLRPERVSAVQDWGRGVWPYRSFWNWGVATGVQDGVRLGVNLGARWTTGTGSNENGILLDGHLHKLMEDLRWDYTPGAWRRPWRVVAEHSGAVDLVLEPVHVHETRTGLGPLSSGGACAFGRWRGRVRAGGREIAVRALPGWAEEFAHRW